MCFFHNKKRIHFKNRDAGCKCGGKEGRAGAGGGGGDTTHLGLAETLGRIAIRIATFKERLASVQASVFSPIKWTPFQATHKVTAT